ncbi:hypothetical protein Lal_00010851 [Lupinus albus]|nr:hypothetical protein Lal_00010851 [Lupinus albus]
MSLSWPFDFIKDVNDSKHLWKIAVRITQLWYVQIPPKSGHLEMILMDSKGDKIQVSVKKDEFNQRNQSLLENKTYVMHNFNVLRNDLQFKACDHVYRMQFTASTTLKQREFHDIPELEYNFKKFSDILSGNFRGDVISYTLWEAHAIKFLNFFNNQPSLQPLVILLTNARVKEGQGNYPPTVSNSWSGSKLLIDEEITNFQKFSSISLSCDTLTQSNSQLSQYSYLSDDDRFLYKVVAKSINEISSLTSFEDMTCVAVGTTTMFVVGRRGWYYDGCAKCTKKADVKDGPFICKCGHFNQISIPRDRKMAKQSRFGSLEEARMVPVLDHPRLGVPGSLERAWPRPGRAPPFLGELHSTRMPSFSCVGRLSDGSALGRDPGKILHCF